MDIILIYFYTTDVEDVERHKYAVNGGTGYSAKAMAT